MHLWPSMRLRDSFKIEYLKKLEWNLHRMKISQKKQQQDTGGGGSNSDDSSQQSLLSDSNNGNTGKFVAVCRELLLLLSCCYCCFCCGACVEDGVDRGRT